MDYGFEHAGRVYTPNGTTGITFAENADRNRAIADAELAYWATRPDQMLAYYHFPRETVPVLDPAQRYRATFTPDSSGAYVSIWPGDRIGTILQARVYQHNFGGRFVSLCVRGTNGAEYYGRASWDWGQCVTLRKVRARA